MKPVVALVVVAGLVVWLFALLPPRKQRGAAEASEVEDAPAQQPWQAQSPPRAQRQGAQAAQPPERAGAEQTPQRAHDDPGARRIREQTRSARLQRPAPAEARPQPDEPRPAPAEPAPEELGEGLLSPEYREREENYVHEPRVADWAHPHEKRVRELLRGADLIEALVLLHCRQQTCRVVMDGVDEDTVSTLLEMGDFQEATALGPGSPYSLRGGRLSLYFRPDAAP